MIHNTTSPDPIEDVVALIVHHNSLSTLHETLANIVRLRPHHVVVIDNSESELVTAQLDQMKSPGVDVVYTSNRGYAAAVNTGVQWINSHIKRPVHILVCTHEVLFVRGTITDLVDAFKTPSVAATGPLLVQRDNPERIWSAGGKMTRLLRLPGHLGLSEPAFRFQTGFLETEWMDGCCILFRHGILEKYPLDEAYFMYFEELDVQTILRRDGYRLWISCAVHASQVTAGPPFHYMVRNYTRYHRKHGSVARALPGLAGLLGREVLRQRSVKPVGTFVTALRSDAPSAPQAPPPSTAPEAIASETIAPEVIAPDTEGIPVSEHPPATSRPPVSSNPPTPAQTTTPPPPPVTAAPSPSTHPPVETSTPMTMIQQTSALKGVYYGAFSTDSLLPNLLAALASGPAYQFSFTIIGDGPLAPEIERFVARNPHHTLLRHDPLGSFATPPEKIDVQGLVHVVPGANIEHFTGLAVYVGDTPPTKEDLPHICTSTATDQHSLSLSHLMQRLAHIATKHSGQPKVIELPPTAPSSQISSSRD